MSTFICNYYSFKIAVVTNAAKIYCNKNLHLKYKQQKYAKNNMNLNQLIYLSNPAVDNIKLE